MHFSVTVICILVTFSSCVLLFTFIKININIYYPIDHIYSVTSFVITLNNNEIKIFLLVRQGGA